MNQAILYSDHLASHENHRDFQFGDSPTSSKWSYSPYKQAYRWGNSGYNPSSGWNPIYNWYGPTFGDLKY